MADYTEGELFKRRFAKHLQTLEDQVADAAERIQNEHPLDTLERVMLDHGWSDDDPMLRQVRLAKKIPYPMPRWEAEERGLIP